MRFKKIKKGWVVKNDRPEEYLKSPEIYYSDEEVEKYSRSGGMERAQQKIASRVLELLDLKNPSLILDLGSGPGFSAEVYREEGHKVICVDLIPKMIEKAKEKGFEGYVSDMREVNKIISKKFDAVVSVSALQWIKEKDEIEKVADNIKKLLKRDCKSIIQFYPKSEEELNNVAKIFSKKGFETKIVIDWPDVPKNRTFYLVITLVKTKNSN